MKLLRYKSRRAVDKCPTFNLLSCFSVLEVNLNGLVQIKFGLFNGWHFKFSVKYILPVDGFEKLMLFNLFRVS